MTYPEALPITARRAEIVEAIEMHPVVVVCGETGSGKSTQLPKLCLEAGRGRSGVIGHTQPRRVAARSIAARIARELESPLGEHVGYKVRFSDRSRQGVLVKVMTDGILLAETQSDRRLRQYDTIIIDEAHERSLNVDFLLGYLRLIRSRRRDLKIVITSATIDPERFSAFFDGAPIIEVSGRAYPVDVRHRPLAVDDPDERDRDTQRAIVEAVDEIAGGGPGDILVFLSGEREIRETAETLRKHHPPATEILPLYARLSAAEQDRVFEPHHGRRVVLATNVAETSLTVPGVRGVVDPGLARISRYSPRSRVQRLPIEPISQASAIQRAGRCGRLGPGVCIRLYGEDDLARRPQQTVPEILRTNLASVILRMKALDLGDPATFPFLDRPRANMIRDGRATLHELGAIDADDRLTDRGRRLARLPVDPRIGAMLLAADDEGCLTEVLVIAAALSVQDPRERPHEHTGSADERHRRFADEHSDFVGWLNLWRFYHEQKRHLSWNKLRLCCRENFLSFVRMREWHDIHQQLRTLVQEIGLRPNATPATMDQIHRALLAGLLRHVGRRGDQHEYQGTHDSKFYIFPGSTLFKKTPTWVMASEIVETTRRYARSVAPVRPEWIERLGSHLLRRRHSEPHWDSRSARVMAYERATLYGLEIVSRRRVPYDRIDPAAARAIFIQKALVEDGLRIEAPFRRHNRGLIDEIRLVEAKRRRRDVLAEMEDRFAFYDRIVPPNVSSGRRFEQWRKQAERDDPRCLFMTRDDVVRPGAEGVPPEAFPDALQLGELALPLEYVLEPGAADDGVTLVVPAALLNQLTEERLEWGVPGLLREKVIALIRSLPKDLRRSFVPAPDFADACVDRIGFGQGGLRAAVAIALREMTGLDVPPHAFDPAAVPEHLRLMVRVTGADGETIAADRDLEGLRGQVGGDATSSFAALASGSFEPRRVTRWDFGDLPRTVEVGGGELTLTGYPTLVDEGDAVTVCALESPESAEAVWRAGLRRLFALACEGELRSQIDYLPGVEEMRVKAAAIDAAADLRQELITLIADRAFLADDADIRSRRAFEERMDAGWPRLWDVGCDVAELVGRILTVRHRIEQDLEAFGGPVWQEHVDDVRRHLADLMPPGFLTATPPGWLAHFPRYLRAIRRRLEKLRQGGRTKDRARVGEHAALWSRYEARRLEHERRGVHDSALAEYRWMLEEWRVSLHAQELGTSIPVSPRRLAAVWATVRS